MKKVVGVSSCTCIICDSEVIELYERDSQGKDIKTWFNENGYEYLECKVNGHEGITKVTSEEDKRTELCIHSTFNIDTD